MASILQYPYDATLKSGIWALERNLLPDLLIRRACRALINMRLKSSTKDTVEEQLQDLLDFVRCKADPRVIFSVRVEKESKDDLSSGSVHIRLGVSEGDVRLFSAGMRVSEGGPLRGERSHLWGWAALKAMPIAINTQDANEQHYEVPTEFYQLFLGKHLKYSSCYFKTPTTTLDDAEEAMLALYCERAQLQDGQEVLELGCGWGSLSLYVAAKYPSSRITGISNSASQRAFIEEEARNCRNSRRLSQVGADRPDDVSIADHWRVNGTHYALTSEAWLKKFDQNLPQLRPIIAKIYGQEQALKWTVYWRTFFLSLSELFGHSGGQEWIVSHYLFKKRN
eukprot:jgi/Mesen1/510/ME000104S10602